MKDINDILAEFILAKKQKKIESNYLPFKLKHRHLNTCPRTK